MRSMRVAAGFTLVEVLVALIVLAFGMLALARVMARSAQEGMEAQQRSQAMTIASEIVDRITNNPKEAPQYVGDYIPEGPAEDCSALDAADIVAHDKCHWVNRLRGIDVVDGNKAIGAPLAARACVINTGLNIYVIAVAWQGLLPTDAADSPCGEDAWGAENERTRRVYSKTIQIATLGV